MVEYVRMLRGPVAVRKYWGSIPFVIGILLILSEFQIIDFPDLPFKAILGIVLVIIAILLLKKQRELHKK